MHEIEQAFARIKGRWMTGGSAVEQAPDPWTGLLDGIDPLRRELRLVALAGQATQLAFEPLAPDDLIAADDLPALKLPPLPTEVRALFRRLLAASKSDRGRQDALLTLVACRGYAAHPADWMPDPADDDVPAIYTPWIAWQRNRTGESQFADVADDLNEENWGTFSPAERRAELAEMRRGSPSVARDLIASKAGSEPAEQRYRLIALLANQLTDDDVDYLESLQNDRSGKVKTLAAALLARLGHLAEPGELEAELADFLKVGKQGLLSSKPKVSARKLKTDAQYRRRAELFELVSLAGLCGVLDLTPDQFLAAWDLKTDARATEALALMVAETAGDELLPEFADQLATTDAHSVGCMPIVANRLSDVQRGELAVKLMGLRSASLSDVVACAGTSLGEMAMDTISAAPACDDLISSIAIFSQEDASASRTRRENIAGTELFNLGLLADTPAAASVATMAVEAGIMSVDPKLDMLRFNEQLPPRQDTTS